MRYLQMSRYITTALLVFILVLIASADISQAADANLNVQFTTTSAGGSYGNKHVHVVWIKDAAGNFVYTVGSTTTDNKRAVWANSRASSLSEWWNSNAANRSADVAARTGATQTAYMPYNFNWNWRKKDGSVVPDGSYQIHFLCTNADSGTPNNKTSFNITKGSSAWSTGPVSQGGYNNISLTFTPAGLGVIAVPATDVTFNSATLNGQVTGINGVNPNVYIYWGDNDGGTDTLSWDEVIDLGVKGAGDFSTNVSGLTQGMTYYYTCRAVGGGDVWSPTTESFTANDINIVFAQGDTWKYFKGTSFPGSNWNNTGFDDTSWLSGPTGIGYADGDDATILSDMQNNYLTVYMRKILLIDTPADISNMTFTVDYDDGFVAFINGQEVARRGVASGQTYQTGATSHEAGTPEEIDITAYKTAMVPGENIFAIEVHNANIGSSDLSMIPEMTMAGGIGDPAGRIGIAPETLDFGAVAIGSDKDIAFDITNTGNDVLEVTSIQAIGLETDVYSVSSAPVLPFTLQPAGTESITVRFSPRSVQDYKYAQLAIGSNAPERVAYLDMEGSGGQDAEFGTRQVGGIGGHAKALAKYGDKILLGQGAMLVLLDVSNPALPVKLNQIRLEGVIEAVTVQGDVAYAALGNKGFAAVDLGNFMPLPGAATFETGGFASDIGSEAGILCVADGIVGTHVYDISNPLEPALVTTYDTAGAVSAVGISAGLLYVLDGSEGITVSQLDISSLQGAVAHWKLDEAAGSLALDSSENGYDGTLMNMDNNDWVAGSNGKALDFDGDNDYVVATGYKGIVGSAPRTCSAWIKTSGTEGNVLSWGKPLDSFGGKWDFRIDTSGAIRVEVRGGNIVGSTVVTDGKWHHVAAVLESGSTDVNQIKLYVDGAIETISSSADEPINTVSEDDVTIGGTSRYFAGQIDDVRIYDYALTAPEMEIIGLRKRYSEIEFGTRTYVDQGKVYATDVFGSLFILDAIGDITLQSETILQVGSLRDIEVQNGYAYATGETGLEVIDVSNPSSPSSVAVYSDVENPEDILLNNTIAYIADAATGLHILDISNPTAISSLGSYSLMSASSAVSSPDSLEDVYVVGNGQSLMSYDLSASARPVSKDTYELLDQAEDIAVEGQHAFVAAGLSGLKIFDLSNPGGTPAAFATDGFANAVSVNGSTAMISDSNKVYVLNISSPMSPTLVASWETDGWGFDVAVGSTHGYVAEGGFGISILDISSALPVGYHPVAGVAYGVAIDADVLYVASGSAGLTILDVSDPVNPSLIAEYELPGVIVDVVKVGDRLCVADALFGISVIDVSDPATPTLYAGAQTSAPTFHISIAGSRILAADSKGGIAVLGVTDWPKKNIGDISNDSQVGFEDLILLAGQWLNVESDLDVLSGNINYYDTTVDIRDFSVLSGYWGSQFAP